MQTEIKPNHPQELPPQPLNIDDLPLEYWELLDAREQDIRNLTTRLKIVLSALGLQGALSCPIDEVKEMVTNLRI